MNEAPGEGSNEIEELRQRVAANPEDAGLRLALGAALVRIGDFHSAIPELQKAELDRQHRAEAIRLLAEAFERLGMPDLAEAQRELAGIIDKFTLDGGPVQSSPAALPRYGPSQSAAAPASNFPNERQNSSSSIRRYSLAAIILIVLACLLALAGVLNVVFASVRG